MAIENTDDAGSHVVSGSSIIRNMIVRWGVLRMSLFWMLTRYVSWSPGFTAVRPSVTLMLSRGTAGARGAVAEAA